MIPLSESSPFNSTHELLPPAAPRRPILRELAKFQRVLRLRRRRRRENNCEKQFTVATETANFSSDSRRSALFFLSEMAQEQQAGIP